MPKKVNRVLFDAAVEAMEECLQDRSVPIEKTLEFMEELEMLLQGHIEGLRDDIRAGRK